MAVAAVVQRALRLCGVGKLPRTRLRPATKAIRRQTRPPHVPLPKRGPRRLLVVLLRLSVRHHRREPSPRSWGAALGSQGSWRNSRQRPPFAWVSEWLEQIEQRLRGAAKPRLQRDRARRGGVSAA